MEATSRILVTYLVNAAWQVPAIAATFAIFARPMRRMPTTYRHSLWVAALFAGVLVPVASLRTPDALPDVVTATSGSSLVSLARGLPIASSSEAEGFSWRVLRRSRRLLLAPLLRYFLVCLYAGFITYRIARLAWAYHRTVRLRRSAFPFSFPESLHEILRGCSTGLGMKKVVVLCSSHAVGPFTLGIREPVLILPERFIASVQADDVRSAVYHELAHVRRHDFLLNLIYEIVYLPISFHLAGHWLKSQVDQTREMVCDEVAAVSLATRRGYARSLLNIAQSLAEPQPACPTYALGLFDANHMEERIMNLLGKANPIGRLRRNLFAVAGAVLLAGACLGISAYSLQFGQGGQEFEGTWKAIHEGKSFIVLRFHTENTGTSGTIQMAGFQLDLQGTGLLVKVTEEKLEPPISLQNIKVDGKSLSFNFVDSDGDDDKMRVELTDKSKASILWIDLPAGLKARPIALTKQANADTKTR